MATNFLSYTFFAFFVGLRDSLLGAVVLFSIDKEKNDETISKLRTEKYGEVERPPGRRGPRPRQGKE